MRVVGGKYRSARLVAPKGLATRPTTDRTRESLFNVLCNRMDLEGVQVLDLFAGSGALGIESISRGAAFCTFVDDAAHARKAIAENISTLSLGEVTRMLRRDATRLGTPDIPGSIGLVFADPPYGKGLGERAVKCLVENHWLAAEAILVLEERKDDIPENLIGFHRVDVRTYGGSAVGLFQFAG